MTVTPAGSAVLVEPAALVDPCPHPDAAELGLSGTVVFLRCLLCGNVLVEDRGQEWSIPSEAPTPREELLQA